MNNSIFKSFLYSLDRNNNRNLLEAILEGYNVIFENEENIIFGEDPQNSFKTATLFKNGEGDVSKSWYSIDFPQEGFINIELIKTPEKYQRQGYATKVIQAIQEKYPDKKIRGLANKKSEKLLQNVGAKVENIIGPVYHGTGKEFYQFEPHVKRNMQMGFGIHFTPEPKFAELYKKGKHGRIIKANLNINKLFDAEKVYDKSSEEGKMLYEMNPKFPWMNNVAGTDKAAYGHRIIDSVTPQKAEQILRKYGYDGVRYISQMRGGMHSPQTRAMISAEAETYVVFDNSQIKQINEDILNESYNKEGGTTTLYRGIVQNGEKRFPGDHYSTDKSFAEKFGEVSEYKIDTSNVLDITDPKTIDKLFGNDVAKSFINGDFWKMMPDKQGFNSRTIDKVIAYAKENGFSGIKYIENYSKDVKPTNYLMLIKPSTKSGDGSESEKMESFDNFLKLLKNSKNESLIEVILEGYKNIFENYTEDLGFLKKYLESDPISVCAHDYHYMIEPWAEMNNYEFPDDIKNLETYEQVEWLEKNDPETFKKYGGFVTNEANNDGHSKVQFDTNPKLLINKWLIHFTDNPYDVWKEGFEYGTDDYEKLGLTTSYKKTSKKGGKFAFAYLTNNFEKYYRGRHGFKYGKGAVVFQASGLYVYHYGDEENQVIFDTSTAKNIMVIEFDETGDPYVGSKNGKKLYTGNNPEMNENEKFTSCVNWIVIHFDQYRKSHDINKKGTKILNESVSIIESIGPVYHGTNDKFEKFDLDKTTMGDIWFSSNKQSIEQGKSGASGTKYIMERYLNISEEKFAGWDLYDKYSLAELINMGYKGVKLPDENEINYIVFDPNDIVKKEYTRENLTESVNYPSGFDISELKSIKSFSGRIKYVNDRLEKIGKGSSRAVYKIDDHTVLKLAINNKGIAQNQVEGDWGLHQMYPDILPELIDKDEDDIWIIKEKANKITESEFEKITKIPFKEFGLAIRKELGRAYGNKFDMNIKVKNFDEIIDDEFVNQIIDMAVNFDFPAGDLTKISSYGEIEDKPVLVDPGLTQEVFKEHYKK